jgi:cytoskeletal protein CcmA (bactofilin family)
VEGWVRADELRIEGLVRGEIAETRKVEICPQGKLVGTVSARFLVVRDGGFLEGQCLVGTESAEGTALNTGTARGSR